MAIQRYEYFYDSQVLRFMMQVVRAFSGFQYMTGARAGEEPRLELVPCTMAKRNRQAAAIQRNMSENTLQSVPMISVDLINFEPNRDQLQNPNHVDTIQITERATDAVTGEYLAGPGNRVTVERLMPRPFMMTVQVDIWTSNMLQKYQLLEQIDTMMFPSFDIQNSDNALDWSALTTVTFESQNFTSISIPVGGENEIDVATINLKIPMWLSPPAKLTRQMVIQQINTNISQAVRDDKGVIVETANLARNITTPGNHHILVERGYITLLGPHASDADHSGNPYAWDDLFASYGTVLYPAETQIRIRETLDEDTSRDIIGTVQPTSDPNQLVWRIDPDTLPRNTIPGVDALLDPLEHVPGEGDVPIATEGQRYLILTDLAGPSLAWGPLTAREGSIIQYEGGSWVVKFAATDHQQSEYVVNRRTGRQLRWNVEAQQWVVAIDGTYAPGMWRLGVI